jgi:hypothetical protein
MNGNRSEKGGGTVRPPSLFWHFASNRMPTPPVRSLSDRYRPYVERDSDLVCPLYGPDGLEVQAVRPGPAGIARIRATGQEEPGQ